MNDERKLRKLEGAATEYSTLSQCPLAPHTSVTAPCVETNSTAQNQNTKSFTPISYGDVLQLACCNTWLDKDCSLWSPRAQQTHSERSRWSR